LAKDTTNPQASPQHRLQVDPGLSRRRVGGWTVAFVAVAGAAIIGLVLYGMVQPDQKTAGEAAPPITTGQRTGAPSTAPPGGRGSANAPQTPDVTKPSDNSKAPPTGK
jgi:hypothetical protein